jgi:hypothetical protein
MRNVANSMKIYPAKGVKTTSFINETLWVIKTRLIEKAEKMVIFHFKYKKKSTFAEVFI